MARDDNLPEQMLPPVRGLVPIQNARGKPIADRDIHRWFRLNRTLYKAEKVDVLVRGAVTGRVAELIAFGQAVSYDHPGRLHEPLYLPISLRTDCSEPPPDLAPFKKNGLFDVFLCPSTVDSPHLEAWFEACREAGVPIRLQIQPPFPQDLNAGILADTLAGAAVSVVNVVLSDPFQPAPPCRDEQESARVVAQMNEITAAIAEREIEANLFGLPICLVAQENRIQAGNSERFFLDHQQYHRQSYEFARLLHPRHPAVIGMAVAALLGRQASFTRPSDEFLLRWLVVGNRDLLFQGVVTLGRLLRRFRVTRGTPSPLEHREIAYQEAVTKAAMRQQRRRQGKNAERVCSECSLSRVCDRETAAFRKQLPGLAIEAQSGEKATSPLAWLRRQPKHYDPVDSARRDDDDDQLALAQEANDIMLNTAPDDTFKFGVMYPEKTFSMLMPGAFRYMSLVDRELVSGMLFWGDAPMTVSVTFGGGIADFVGFTLWDTIRILCPMEEFSHQVVLHVAADGRYVLLRDGVPVRPAEFQGKYYVPQRLPTNFKLRLSVWNMEGGLCVQNPLRWSGAPQADTKREAVKYSVIVVSTRYARRLQAVLQSIAHQEGVDLGKIEVIVGYVPGIDATDDLLTSVQLSHPDLRIVRSPFSAQHASSKGLIINRSLPTASGEWIVLLDSDIVLAPRLFAELEKVDEFHMLAAPIGRKMLTPDVTAEVLLGELRPWRDWDRLLEGPGGNRYGENREGGRIPVGFCQCIRASCFKDLKYNEYDHFEGADWEFARDVVAEYGDCAWLDVPVLHLDHGGCQWYGTRTQR